MKIPSEAEAQEAFNATFKPIPTLNTWGFFAHDDASGGIGGGAGMFSWFDNENSLIEFVVKYPLLAQTSEECDLERLQLAHSIVQPALQIGHLTDQIVQKLNAAIRGVEQITWVGQLSDLTTGDGAFAKELRRNFGHSDEHVVSDEELDRFIDYLRNYGY